MPCDFLMQVSRVVSHRLHCIRASRYSWIWQVEALLQKSWIHWVKLKQTCSSISKLKSGTVVRLHLWLFLMMLYVDLCLSFIILEGIGVIGESWLKLSINYIWQGSNLRKSTTEKAHIPILGLSLGVTSQVAHSCPLLVDVAVVSS